MTTSGDPNLPDDQPSVKPKSHIDALVWGVVGIGFLGLVLAPFTKGWTLLASALALIFFYAK